MDSLGTYVVKPLSDFSHILKLLTEFDPWVINGHLVTPPELFKYT
jgi:hypothetical protein